VVRKTLSGDDRKDVLAAFESAKKSELNLVLITGGLGRQRWFGPAIARWIFRLRDRRISAKQSRQSMNILSEGEEKWLHWYSPSPFACLRTFYNSLIKSVLHQECGLERNGKAIGMSPCWRTPWDEKAHEGFCPSKASRDLPTTPVIHLNVIKTVRYMAKAASWFDFGLGKCPASSNRCLPSQIGWAMSNLRFDRIGNSKKS